MEVGSIDAFNLQLWGIGGVGLVESRILELTQRPSQFQFVQFLEGTWIRNKDSIQAAALIPPGFDPTRLSLYRVKVRSSSLSELSYGEGNLGMGETFKGVFAQDLVPPAGHNLAVFIGPNLGEEH